MTSRGVTGLRVLLTNEPERILVDEASTDQGARELCAEVRPEIRLLDLGLPGPLADDTLTFLRDASPEMRAVMLAVCQDEVAPR